VDVLTAMRALTETPAQVRRAEPAAAPAVTRVAVVDDDVPDLNAVTAVTGRRPESFSAEASPSAQREGAARGSSPARAETLVDLPGAAKVCADMARVLDASDLPGLMLRLAGVLGSPGLIVWVADRSGQVLMPLLTHGYPAAAVARIGSLPTSAENATALAWRTGDVQIVPGALVAPIVTSDGCVGALAAELPEGSESRADVRALATIFAAQLATFVTALPSVGGEQIAAST
jgi:GAF domain-containing protein